MSNTKHTKNPRVAHPHSQERHKDPTFPRQQQQQHGSTPRDSPRQRTARAKSQRRPIRIEPHWAAPPSPWKLPQAATSLPYEHLEQTEPRRRIRARRWSGRHVRVLGEAGRRMRGWEVAAAAESCCVRWEGDRLVLEVQRREVRPRRREAAAPAAQEPSGRSPQRREQVGNEESRIRFQTETHRIELIKRKTEPNQPI